MVALPTGSSEIRETKQRLICVLPVTLATGTKGYE